MYDCKSDYALNKKDKEAIVYRDASGKLVRLTAEDFSCPADFLMWKAWSDANYHEADLEGNAYSKHTNSLSEGSAVAPSPEIAMIEAYDEQKRGELCRLLMDVLDTRLTSAQRRRLWMFCVDGMTEREIAAAENVTQQSVSECLCRAKENLKKLLNSPL